MRTATEEEQLLEFLYMCPVGIVDLDNSGRVQLVNPEAANIIAATLGTVNLEELLPVFETFAPDLVALTTDPDGRHGRLVEDRLVQVWSPARGIATISMTLVRISPIRLMLVISDQTHATRARRLESLGQLAGGIAHDFNNLLGVISGHAGILSSGLKAAHGQLGEPELTSLSRDADQILNTVGRAAQLTRRLLAFARREPVKAEVFDVDATIGGVLDMLDRTLGSQIMVDSALNARGARISMDPGQLEQVLLNLVVNSRDAMPDGGHLRIATTTVQLTAAHLLSATGLRPGWYVRTSVADSGTGMAREVADRAFDPFFTTRQEDGSGLGLSTVYSIITGAGGHVELASAPGEGTTVTFLLPVSEDPTPAV